MKSLFALLICLTVGLAGCEEGMPPAYEEGAILFDLDGRARDEAKEYVLARGEFDLTITPEPAMYGVPGTHRCEPDSILYDEVKPYVGLTRIKHDIRGWCFYSATMGRMVEGFSCTQPQEIYVALDPAGNYDHEIAVHEFAHLWLSVNGFGITQPWLP